MQDQKEFEGGYMSKKSKKNYIVKTNDFLDMSYRNKIDVDTNREYSDEELNALIAELSKQLQELNDLHKELYSLNASIERISQRTFLDILREKFDSILGNIFNKNNQNIIEKGFAKK